MPFTRNIILEAMKSFIKKRKSLMLSSIRRGWWCMRSCSDTAVLQTMLSQQCCGTVAWVTWADCLRLRCCDHTPAGVRLSTLSYCESLGPETHSLSSAQQWTRHVLCSVLHSFPAALIKNADFSKLSMIVWDLCEELNSSHQHSVENSWHWNTKW